MILILIDFDLIYKLLFNKRFCHFFLSLVILVDICRELNLFRPELMIFSLNVMKNGYNSREINYEFVMKFVEFCLSQQFYGK